ncbi:Uncharacterized protein FKW44_018318, partial [Caligus rogercresseyi]
MSSAPLDKTPFSLSGMVASETGFFLALNPNDAPGDVRHVGKKRSVANLQILKVVSSDVGKCPHIFLGEKMRLNSITYVEILWDTVFPWAHANYGTGWIFQQDGARPHTAANTQKFLQANAPRFIDKDSCPPYSPDR